MTSPPANRSFVYRTPVRFNDVDHAGIVYYPLFFHYFHLAFEEMFRARMGARAYVELLDRDRVGFPVVASECEFLAPLRFGDDVEIELRVARIGGKSVTFQYTARRVEGGVDAARGKVVCAVTNLDSFQAVEIPPSLRALFSEFAD